MDGIHVPGLIWSGIMGVSQQTALAHMEEEKAFIASTFVIISLPVSKRLKKRRISKKRRHSVKKVNAKANADWSIRKNKC